MLKFPTKKTPVLCQGITGEIGSVHTELAIAYGGHIVAGVSHDKSVHEYLGIPVFNTVKEAVRKTNPQVSVVFSTPSRALADVEEAIRAKIPLIVCTTEHVPVHDVFKMVALAQKYQVTLLGPSSPGIVRVGECLAGTIPAHLFPKGRIGLIGRSSSLIYEAVQQLAEKNLGVSTCVALGAADLVGTPFVPILNAMLSDKQTDAVLVIGQVAGNLEAELAESYRKTKRQKKPLIVYIPGHSITDRQRIPLLGAGALIPSEIVAEKKALMKKAGIVWIDNPAEMGQVVADTVRDKK